MTLYRIDDAILYPKFACLTVAATFSVSLSVFTAPFKTDLTVGRYLSLTVRDDNDFDR